MIVLLEDITHYIFVSLFYSKLNRTTSSSTSTPLNVKQRCIKKTKVFCSVYILHLSPLYYHYCCLVACHLKLPRSTCCCCSYSCNNVQAFTYHLTIIIKSHLWYLVWWYDNYGKKWRLCERHAEEITDVRWDDACNTRVINVFFPLIPDKKDSGW